jgi:hypothetical protein
LPGCSPITASRRCRPSSSRSFCFFFQKEALASLIAF